MAHRWEIRVVGGQQPFTELDGIAVSSSDGQTLLTEAVSQDHLFALLATIYRHGWELISVRRLDG